MNETKQFAEVMNRLARVAPPPVPRRAAIVAGAKIPNIQIKKGNPK